MDDDLIFLLGCQNGPKVVEQLLWSGVTSRFRELRMALFQLAELYLFTDRPEDANPILCKLLDDHRELEEKEIYLFLLGKLMAKKGDVHAAIGYYKSAQLMEPEDRETWYLIHNNLGCLYNALGRFKEADYYLREAIRINSQLQEAYVDLGYSLVNQGLFPEAAKYFLEAAKLTSNESCSCSLAWLLYILLEHREILSTEPNMVSSLKELQNKSVEEIHFRVFWKCIENPGLDRLQVYYELKGISDNHQVKD